MIVLCSSLETLPENSLMGVAILTAALSTELSIENRIHAVNLLGIVLQEDEFIGFSVIVTIERRMRVQINTSTNTSFKYVTSVLLAITSGLPDKGKPR
ncbi:BEM_HP_G0080820.mRNA.1.CDS.1 [Saccharomyces cerevisiae]|nr:BEM_HP_G0080820.mRNA.1.CDS.1 [Saccharomyces cerevisiae]CAI6992508.1 BEM_HP_G0080820.mRNA.1.CDS.1 [Saccharomyces cerevisiae]